MPLRRPDASATWRTDKFTARAKKAMHLAQQEAQRLHQSPLGTQHLLLGLVREGEGLAARVLARHGVELEAVRLAAASTDTSDSAPPLAAAVERAVDRARHEAQELGHKFVGTEHLLLAVLHEDHGMALSLLQSLGVDPEAIAADVLVATSISVTSSATRSQRQGELAPGPKDNVVSCRVDDRAVEAIDALVAAGIRSTRSDAAAWLIRSGIEANREFFEQVYTTVGEIRRLREQAQALARQSPSD